MKNIDYINLEDYNGNPYLKIIPQNVIDSPDSKETADYLETAYKKKTGQKIAGSYMQLAINALKKEKKFRQNGMPASMGRLWAAVDNLDSNNKNEAKKGR